MTDDRQNAKRWCFTINNPTDEDRFWLDKDGNTNDLLHNVEYLVLQEERGENGTLHWQGFVILTKRQRLAWLKRRFNQRAHWEVCRGTNEQAAEYCKKADTYTGGLRYEYGKLPDKPVAKKRDERLQEACEELDVIKESFKRPRDIPSMTLLQCGFIPAMNALNADRLGPYRPNLKIITLVGPPACGKSYAIQHFFPEHGRCIGGNNGCWFQNPTSNVMLFEEFCGQIRLQQMLQLLDPYPLSLEVKGGMRPAMYELVLITSNTSPRFWYKPEQQRDDEPPDPKRMDAIHALWDRIGFNSGDYIPRRTNGHYIEAPSVSECLGMSPDDYIKHCREFFWNKLAEITGQDPIEDDDD